MAKERIKNVTIPVYDQETLDRLTEHFPSGYSREETLIRLLDAYDRRDDADQAELAAKELTAEVQQLTAEVQQLTANLQNGTETVQTAVDNLQNLLQNLPKEYYELTTDYYEDTTPVQKDTTPVQKFTTAVQKLTTTVQNVTTTVQKLTTDVQILTTDVQNKQEKMQYLVEQQVSPNAIVVNAPEWSRRLLEATTARLSERYGKTVTPDMVLLDMFNRYTIERWSQWFYPFVLADGDIAELTGIDIRTLKSYLKSK